ncbi:hypothetical protein CWI36_0688p0010, partial [Hamiltosporidium magnivora]
MCRRKKVDSENIKNEKIKDVNNLENSAGEILMCDANVAILSERLPPPPTFHDTTHHSPSSSCQTSSVCLVDTIPSSSGTDVTACEPRMPRNGWPATLRYYNEKFSCTLEIVAQEENGERRKIATCLTEPSTLTETTEYINLRDKFLSKIKEISMKEIGKVVVRTRKHLNELVDSKVLDLINRIIGEYADSCVPMTITAVARIIQAAQVCYEKATCKEKPRSAWKENIESKISKLVLSKDLLEKARKQEKLSTSKTKSLKKIIQEFNLNLSSVTDLSEALVMKNESLNVYEKKITMHESRKQFRKENRMFELFRGRFYRG